MQYTIEYLELWWACVASSMKDNSLAFPISLVLGAIAGGLFWWLAAQSARLWNQRYTLNLGVQVLCGVAAMLAVILAITFTSSRHMEAAAKVRLNIWKQETENNQEWKNDAFCEAWDAVARTGQEADVRVEPSPRTDPTLQSLSMGHPESKKAVIRTYVASALKKFAKESPYLHGIINPSPEIPEERLNFSLQSWFTDHPGTPFPAEQGVAVVVTILEEEAKGKIEAVASYTKRLSLALFVITQLIVFGVIAFVANRSNRPATVA
jgi:hypothetical protein